MYFQYGVCVFRKTALNDESHAALAHQFGDVETLKGTPATTSRLKSIKYTDQSNLEVNGELLDPNGPKAKVNKGNELFHVDGSYNVRRTHFSILRAYEVPPPGSGAHTEFADTRTAYSDLPDSWKSELLEENYTANHSFWHSRKTASPEYFASVDPTKYPASKHKLVQKHIPSGRINLYAPSHIQSIDNLAEEDSRTKLEFLRGHATQDKYVLKVEWFEKGDLVIWDNTCTLHRATPLVGQHRRDMRRIGVRVPYFTSKIELTRTQVFDSGPDAYGENPKDDDLDFAFNKEVISDIMRSLSGQ